jgi:energy-coupling factor transporter ATP-binding protein EcfA2
MKNMFVKPITRDINGVIKVPQRTDADVRTEIEEYVVTNELRKHLHTFFEAFKRSVHGDTDKVGVWISGFFGSGKSHLLKILSYILDHKIDRTVVAHLIDQLTDDAMLKANIQRAVDVPKDVIIFNIDAEAAPDAKARKQAIVEVLMRVFNKHLGYSEDPTTSEFERYLVSEGKYHDFKIRYATTHNREWDADRVFFQLREDRIITVLSDLFRITKPDAKAKLNYFYTNKREYNIIEFAEIISAYIAQKGTKHKVIFMIDEIGQYIGQNPDLMLNLQTVVEELGSRCKGNAWVIVTSQEEITSIVGEMRRNDFSKITGRFDTRLNLSAANADEVIRLRLLKKTPEASRILERYYDTNKDAIKNLITFTADTPYQPTYDTTDSYVSNYPFVPYQYNLIKNSFDQIRINGASGKHLAKGERSMLAAFQIAGKRYLSDSHTASAGARIVPLHYFYESVEGFLDGNIRRVFEQAESNPKLSSFDRDVLRVLFLVKWAKDLPTNARNVAMLCVDDINVNITDLQKKVSDSLERLTQQVLVQRINDLYDFLTDSEQAVAREIRNFPVGPEVAASELNKFVWDAVLKDVKNYQASYGVTYQFSRYIDDLSYGNATHPLSVRIITPHAADLHKDLVPNRGDASAALAYSTRTLGAIIVLPAESSANLLDELYDFVKTDRFLRDRVGETRPDYVRIIEVKKAENRMRAENLTKIITEAIKAAKFYNAGHELAPNRASTTTPSALVLSALSATAATTFSKAEYIKTRHKDALGLMDSVNQIISNDGRMFSGDHVNARAHSEFKEWLGARVHARKTTALSDAQENFRKAPYGWSDFDVVTVTLELYASAQVTIQHKGIDLHEITPDAIKLLTTGKGESVTLNMDAPIPQPIVSNARRFATDVLNVTNPPADARALFTTIREAINEIKTTITRCLDLTSGRKAPFKEALAAGLATANELQAKESPADLLHHIHENTHNLTNDFTQTLKALAFFEHQYPQYLTAVDKYDSLRSDIKAANDVNVNAMVAEIDAIINLEDPSGEIPHLTELVNDLTEQVANQVQLKRYEVAQRIEDDIQSLRATAQKHGLNDEDLERLVAPMREHKAKAEAADSIAEAYGAQRAADAESATIEHAIIAHANAEQSAPTQSLRAAEFTNNKLLTTPEDAAAFIQKLEQAIISAIAAGNVVDIK